MEEKSIEIIIDNLIPKTHIKLIECMGFIFIKKFQIKNSTLSYKLNKSYIYNKLIEQLYMNDSLIVLIKNKNTLFESIIVINNINIFNQILYKLNLSMYTLYFYGLNLENLPVHSTI